MGGGGGGAELSARGAGRLNGADEAVEPQALAVLLRAVLRCAGVSTRGAGVCQGVIREHAPSITPNASASPLEHHIRTERHTPSSPHTHGISPQPPHSPLAPLSTLPQCAQRSTHLGALSHEGETIQVSLVHHVDRVVHGGALHHLVVWGGRGVGCGAGA